MKQLVVTYLPCRPPDHSRQKQQLQNLLVPPPPFGRRTTMKGDSDEC